MQSWQFFSELDKIYSFKEEDNTARKALILIGFGKT